MLRRLTVAPWRAALLLAVACLGACGSLPPIAPGLATQGALRIADDRFSVDGRLSARQDERHTAAHFSWQHAATRDEILLTTPLGQGLAELVRDETGARLRLADRREFVADDWEALAARLFGFAPPLSSLPRWLSARVPPEARGVARDATGRPQRLAIGEWEIAYAEYASAAADALPTLIEMRRADIELRLRIDRWQAGSAESTP